MKTPGQPEQQELTAIMETHNAIVNRIGRVFRPSPDTSSVVSALRVPEVGEALRRQKNLRGPGRELHIIRLDRQRLTLLPLPAFGFEFRFVLIFILVLLLYFVIAHPATWTYLIFDVLGYSRLKAMPEPTTDL